MAESDKIYAILGFDHEAGSTKPIIIALNY